ncbi:hypothetical protein, partial [Leucobacter aridicollis]
GKSVAIILWELLTMVLVPLAAAGIAAWVVIAQIQQLDRHKVSDRKAEAIGILTGHVAEMSSIIVKSVSEPTSTYTQDDRFRLNIGYVKALALLEGDEQDVARWVSVKTNELYDRAKELRAQSENANESAKCVRNQTWGAASAIMQNMLDWQRGTIPTKWFSSQLN